jgi:hypothetical protein
MCEHGHIAAPWRQAHLMTTTFPLAAVFGALLLFAPAQGQTQAVDGAATDTQQLLSSWNASNATCRDQTAAALAAIAACEQRDTLSKRLAQLSYCHKRADGTGPGTWLMCGGDRVPSAARTSVTFQRAGGTFVLPATLDGTHKVFCVVDSGATHMQIPEDVVEEMKRSGALTDADFLGQQRYTFADGRGAQQRVFRLRTLQVGDRIMENVTASVGAPRSRPLLGQSFLRRLNAWKIDNVKNAMELEFSGSY